MTIDPGTILELTETQWQYGDGPIRIRVTKVLDHLSRYYDGKKIWIEGERLDDQGKPGEITQILVRLSSLSAASCSIIDEASRTQAHPGIAFRPGSTGRRAALTNGPDVWEVVAALKAIQDERGSIDRDQLMAELSAATGLSTWRLAVALRYYAAYLAEIDERIALNREAAERRLDLGQR